MDKESPSTPISTPPSAKKRSAARGTPLFVMAIYSWSFPIALLITFIIGFFLGYVIRPMSNTVQAVRPTSATNQMITAQNESQRQQMLELLAAQTKNYIGNPNAPVRMYEFSDFRCPYCAKYHLETGKRILSNYVNQGKVYLGFIHLAILGEESVQAAVASECAAEQEKFWEYHDLLFAERQSGKTPDYSADNLKNLAQQLDLDTEMFAECLESGRNISTVMEQTQFARQLGLNSTPSFIIDGKAIVGAQAYEVFESVIEEALKQNAP